MELTPKEILKRRLHQYLVAEEKILRGQSYVIGERSLTRADLKYVQQEIDNLLVELAAADDSRGRTKRAIFID